MWDTSESRKIALAGGVAPGMVPIIHRWIGDDRDVDKAFAIRKNNSAFLHFRVYQKVIIYEL